MRTPSRPTPDMYDYATRRPCCIIASVEKTYQSSFVFYTGPQSHHVQRKVHIQEPDWLYRRSKEQKNYQPPRGTQTHPDRDKLRSEAKDLRIFAKEFGRGARQQRARGKTKENSGTLPLALSMMQINGRQPTVIDIIEEFQCLEEHTKGTEPVRSFTVAYYKADVVALKHNYKRYLEPFFLAVLLENIHMDRNRSAKDNLIMQWLEQSEEDPLVYEFGNEDRQNSPNCILDKVEIVEDGERFILALTEEQRLTKLANGSGSEDHQESSDEDDVDASSDENADVSSGNNANDQPPHLDGLSRSGCRTT